MDQTIAYLPELPTIRYYSKPTILSNSPASVDQCKLADSSSGEETLDTIINPKGLVSKSSNSYPRTKRSASKVY